MGASNDRSMAIDLSLDAPTGTQRQIGSISLVLPARVIGNVAIDRRFSRTPRTLQIRNIVLRPQGNVALLIGDSEMLRDFTALTTSLLRLAKYRVISSQVFSPPLHSPWMGLLM